MLALIIPYFKLYFFKETLDSLANQTHKGFKVYIGDDSSPENPSELLTKYEDRFDFVYQRFKKNLGGISLTKQWERCLEMIEDQEWFMILGDDDVLSENVVFDFYQNLDVFKNKSNVIRFSTQIINEKGDKISGEYKQPIWEAALNSYVRKCNGENRSSLSEYIFKVTAYKNYGFRSYPLAWHSDDMALIDFSQDKDIFSINSSIVFVRQSNVNISGKKDNLSEKLEAENDFNFDLLSNYRNKLKKDEILLFLKLFEYSFFCNKKQSINHTQLLLFLNIKYRSFKSTFTLLKSLLYKFINTESN